jgi:hypothetical protein
MERLKRLAVTALIALLSVAGFVTGEPNEPGEERMQSYGLIQGADDGGWLPAPNERSPRQPLPQEWLFAVHSFGNAGTVYNLELYYRPLYSTLRIRVLANGRELHGLLNRFYGFPSEGRCMLLVDRDPDGSPTISTNFTQLVLKESAIDTDAIYGAIESFLSKSGASQGSPCSSVDPPPGLLRKTCRVRMMGDPVVDYLVGEDGMVEPSTFDSLRRAYNKEGIKAKTPDDYKEIAWSLIVAEHESTSRDEIVLVSHVSEIPDYSPHSLDPETEAEVKAPQVRSEDETHTDYWTCYTYEQFHGVVARCTFGFREGQLDSAEKFVLGDGIGNASYLGGELPQVPGNATRPRRSPFGTFGLMSVTVGSLLLFCAFLVQRARASSRMRGREH